METLSDKLYLDTPGETIIPSDRKLIKEFIRELKEELLGEWIYDRYEIGNSDALIRFIDKLAGDKLI